MAKKILAAALFCAFTASAALADELIIFHKPGCRPCAQLKKMLDENPDVMRGFQVSHVDVSQDHGSAELFRISSVPTIVRLDDRTREVSRVVGLASKREMAQWLERHNTK
jgi:thioredoxin-like negative regulator of GroEL